MARGAMKTAQPRLRHHPGDESGRPWVVDQKCAAVAGGVARTIQCRAARCAGASAHRRKRATVAPVACNALPGDHAMIGEIARFGFGDAQAGQAALGIDKRALPQPMLIAGAAHDGDRGGTRSEPWRDIANLRSRSATSDTCQQEADPRPRFDGHCRSCTETIAAGCQSRLRARVKSARWRRAEFERQIHCLHMLGESANRDAVHPVFGNCANAGQIHAA